MIIWLSITFNNAKQFNLKLKYFKIFFFLSLTSQPFFVLLKLPSCSTLEKHFSVPETQSNTLIKPTPFTYYNVECMPIHNHQVNMGSRSANNILTYLLNYTHAMYIPLARKTKSLLIFWFTS